MYVGIDRRQVGQQGKTLVRSSDGRQLAGVCAGLADYSGQDVKLVRALFIVLGLMGVGTLIYVVLWLYLPQA